MNKIYYGIASYHRPNCPTLKTLLEIGIPKENIVISLNDENDYKEYKERYANEVKVIYKYGTNVACNRNNILNYFNNGDYVMVLDDDIKSIKKYVMNESKYGKLVRLEREELEIMLLEAFEEAKKINSSFFGTYAIDNTMMLKSTITGQGLYSINKMFQGGSTGFIVDEETRYDESMLLLDDYEIILNNIKKGKYVPRRNDIVFCTPKMGSSEGGYFDIYKQGKQKEYLIKLSKKYPGWFKIKKDYSGIILRKGL